MANAITLAKIYLPLLDEVYKMTSKTSIFDNNTLVRQGSQANEILLPKITLQGLGSYGRNTGFVDGDVTLEWQTHQLTQDRGRSFQVDTMDDMESINQAFGNLSSEFLRTKVVPEIDAYRIAKMYSKKGAEATGTLTKSTVSAAVDTGYEAMTENEVPEEGRVLLVTPSVYTFLTQSDMFVRNISVQAGNGIDTRVDLYNGMPVIIVPQTRMYTALTIYDGSTAGQEAGGYIKNAGTGKDINFMIVQKSAVLGVTKHIAPRIFDPFINQSADAWKFQYRIYHDLFVPDNKTNGIYVHRKA